MGKFNKFNKSNFKPQGIIALILFFGLFIIIVVYFFKKCFFISKQSNTNSITEVEANTVSKSNINKTNHNQSKSNIVCPSLAMKSKLKEINKKPKDPCLIYEGLSGIIKKKKY
jgi:hypothetical protein